MVGEQFVVQLLLCFGFGCFEEFFIEGLVNYIYVFFFDFFNLDWI